MNILKTNPKTEDIQIEIQIRLNDSVVICKQFYFSKKIFTVFRFGCFSELVSCKHTNLIFTLFKNSDAFQKDCLTPDK